MKVARFSFKNIFLGVICFSILAVSCTTIPDTVPDSDREIVQQAQNAVEKGDYRLARWYYEKLLENYGENPAIYIEGNYEIAHLSIKKKKYEDALPRLEEILLIYDNVAPGMLPGAFKKMAENDLAKIPQKKIDEIHEKAKAEEQARVEAELKKKQEEEARMIEEAVNTAAEDFEWTEDENPEDSEANPQSE